jgi:hypothetical protein
MTDFSGVLPATDYHSKLGRISSPRGLKGLCGRWLADTNTQDIAALATCSQMYKLSDIGIVTSEKVKESVDRLIRVV